MRENLLSGLVSVYVDRHHAISAGKAQASSVPGESLVLAGTSLANSLSSREPELRVKDEAISTQYKMFCRLCPVCPCVTPILGKRKIRFLLSHIDGCSYYLHGSSNFVRCRVNTETGEALVLHQRAQNLHR